MARYIKYPSGDGGFVFVEIEDGPPAQQGGVVQAGRVGDKVKDTFEEVQTAFEDAVDIVQKPAQAIINKMKDLTDPPDTVEVTFGLKAAGELGNFAIAKVSAEANYTVKLTWTRAEKRPEEPGSN